MSHPSGTAPCSRRGDLLAPTTRSCALSNAYVSDCQGLPCKRLQAARGLGAQEKDCMSCENAHIGRRRHAFRARCFAPSLARCALTQLALALCSRLGSRGRTPPKTGDILGFTTQLYGCVAAPVSGVLDAPRSCGAVVSEKRSQDAHKRKGVRHMRTPVKTTSRLLSFHSAEVMR